MFISGLYIAHFVITILKPTIKQINFHLVLKAKEFSEKGFLKSNAYLDEIQGTAPVQFFPIHTNPKT